jgi:hypothetical protein
MDPSAAVRSLPGLEQWLDTLSSSTAATGPIYEPREFLNHLRDVNAIQIFLRSVLMDEASLTRIAYRSYRHYNHFDKIVLAESEFSGYRTTLHIWRPPFSVEQTEEERIHSHRFNFWSAILVGTLHSQNYECDAKGNLYHAYEYLPLGSRADCVYRYVGTERLCEISHTAASAGELYVMPYHRIHRVNILADQFVATLVLRGPIIQPVARVYSSTQVMTDLDCVPPLMTPQDLTQTLHELLSNLK